MKLKMGWPVHTRGRITNMNEKTFRTLLSQTFTRNIRITSITFFTSGPLKNITHLKYFCNEFWYYVISMSHLKFSKSELTFDFENFKFEINIINYCIINLFQKIDMLKMYLLGLWCKNVSTWLASWWLLLIAQTRPRHSAHLSPLGCLYLGTNLN